MGKVQHNALKEQAQDIVPNVQTPPPPAALNKTPWVASDAITSKTIKQYMANTTSWRIMERNQVLMGSGQASVSGQRQRLRCDGFRTELVRKPYGFRTETVWNWSGCGLAEVRLGKLFGPSLFFACSMPKAEKTQAKSHTLILCTQSFLYIASFFYLAHMANIHTRTGLAGSVWRKKLKRRFVDKMF